MECTSGCSLVAKFKKNTNHDYNSSDDREPSSTVSAWQKRAGAWAACDVRKAAVEIRSTAQPIDEPGNYETNCSKKHWLLNVEPDVGETSPTGDPPHRRYSSEGTHSAAIRGYRGSGDGPKATSSSIAASNGRPLEGIRPGNPCGIPKSDSNKYMKRKKGKSMQHQFADYEIIVSAHQPQQTSTKRTI